MQQAVLPSVISFLDGKSMEDGVHSTSVCWYCGKLMEDGDNNNRFSWEFDTYVHLQCVHQALLNDPDDPEARLILGSI